MDMTRPVTRNRTALLCASLLLVFAVGCKKEKAGPSAQETTPTKADPGTKTADPGSGKIKAPEVAIGATKVATFSGPTKEIASTDEYAVSIQVPDSAAAGKLAAAKVILNPKKGWKLNDEFPYALEITAPAGVKLGKAVQEKADAVKWETKTAAEWAISFTPESAGAKSFSGTFSFAVCTDQTCNPYEEKVAFNVDVK